MVTAASGLQNYTFVVYDIFYRFNMVEMVFFRFRERILANEEKKNSAFVFDRDIEMKVRICTTKSNANSCPPAPEIFTRNPKQSEINIVH